MHLFSADRAQTVNNKNQDNELLSPNKGVLWHGTVWFCIATRRLQSIDTEWLVWHWTTKCWADNLRCGVSLIHTTEQRGPVGAKKKDHIIVDCPIRSGRKGKKNKLSWAVDKPAFIQRMKTRWTSSSSFPSISGRDGLSCQIEWKYSCHDAV